MKFLRKIGLFLILTLLCHALCSCTLLTKELSAILSEFDPFSLISLRSKDSMIVFFYETDPENQAQSMTASQLKSYHSPSARYGSTVYFDSLNEDEQAVYNAILYALDHSLQCIAPDDRLLDRSDHTFVEIYQMASLDSPLIPQNLYFTSTYLTASLSFLEPRASFTAYSVPAFSKAQEEQRAQALQKAQTLVDTAKYKSSPAEIAEFFYRYLGKNVTYTLETTENPCYLYDTLISEQTLCDGFANTFSLLCNMAGIPCFEKAYYTEDDPETEEEEAGHTWNCVYLDGIWCNVDATASSEVTKNGILLRCFGYGDALEDHAPDTFGATLPQAAQLTPFDLILPDMKAADAPQKISAAFKQKGSGDLLVLFEEVPETDPAYSLRIIAEEILKNTRGDVGYSGYAMADKYVCYYYET